MKVKTGKVLIIAAAVLLVVLIGALFIPINSADDGALMTIACFSDPHHEYGVEQTDKKVRASTEKAVNYVKELTGGVDLVMVGGDIAGRNGEWNDDNIKEMMNASFDVFKSASTDGKVLLVTGNHDPEPSVHGEVTSINSNDYSQCIKAGLGDFDAAYYTSDLDNEFAGPFEELLCYRYKINGINFIGLNTPYGDRREVKQVGHNGLYYEQVEWLQKQLEAIGKDETVFVLCHYPVDNISTVYVATEKVDSEEYNASRELMTQLVSEYDNMIYCYGHVHTEKHEAFFESGEIVGTFSDEGAIACHMGSLGYYNDHFGGPLAFEDPTVVQVTMIYIYTDRIVFEVHNTGGSEAYGGEYTLKPYVVMRDMSAAQKKTNLFSLLFK